MGRKELTRWNFSMIMADSVGLTPWLSPYLESVRCRTSARFTSSLWTVRSSIFQISGLQRIIFIKFLKWQETTIACTYAKSITFKEWFQQDKWTIVLLKNKIETLKNQIVYIRNNGTPRHIDWSGVYQYVTYMICWIFLGTCNF